MVGAVDRVVDLFHPTGDAGRGLIVHDQNRFEAVCLVLAQLGLDCGGINAVAPVARYEFDHDPEPIGHLAPQGGEPAGLERQNRIAR